MNDKDFCELNKHLTELLNAHETAIRELGIELKFIRQFSHSQLNRINKLESEVERLSKSSAVPKINESEKPHNSLDDDLINMKKCFDKGKLEGLKRALEIVSSETHTPNKVCCSFPLSALLRAEIKKLEESE